MIQTWKIKKNLISSPILGHQHFYHDFYLYWCLDVISNHPMQFKEKIVNQTWENDKKPNFKPDFGLFGLNLGLQLFFREFYLY